MTIKHIVINGGGPNMWYMYGALKHLHDEKVWQLENIENILSNKEKEILQI